MKNRRAQLLTAILTYLIGSLLFAFWMYHSTYKDHLQAIDEMADLGCNSVEIITPAFQTDGQSQQVRIETGPKRGPLRWQLLALLHHAHQRGLTTTLMPQVLFTHPRGNEWRGKINPPNWGPWWDSYQRVIDYFLDIAQEASVDVFCVGSESREEVSRKVWASQFPTIFKTIDSSSGYVV